MPSEKILAAKQQRVEDLTSELKGATTYVFVATRGLTVAQDTEMRSELRKNGVKFEVPDQTTIIVKGIDKQAVGQMAAVIRSKRPPEPYLGKGIKYSGERIRRKAGKTGK